MLEFTGALAAFLVSHTLPAATDLRGRLVERMGERIYRLVYGGLSILLLAWLISAAVRAPVIMLWWPQSWHSLMPLLLMPVAIILITAATISPNPLSISLRSVAYDPTRPGIVAVTRHPMLWGFALWALSHMIANGDVVSFILFGGLCAFALYGMQLFDRRMKQRLGEAEWHRLADNTSIMPFAAVFRGRARQVLDRRVAVSITLGSALYVWFLVHGHAALIGADPLARL